MLKFGSSLKLEKATLDNGTNFLLKFKRRVKNYPKILHIGLYVCGEGAFTVAEGLKNNAFLFVIV